MNHIQKMIKILLYQSLNAYINLILWNYLSHQNPSLNLLLKNLLSLQINNQNKRKKIQILSLKHSKDLLHKMIQSSELIWNFFPNIKENTTLVSSIFSSISSPKSHKAIKSLINHNIKSQRDTDKNKASLKKESNLHYQALAQKNSIYYQQVQNRNYKKSYIKQT